MVTKEIELLKTHLAALVKDADPVEAPAKTKKAPVKPATVPAEGEKPTLKPYEERGAAPKGFQEEYKERTLTTFPDERSAWQTVQKASDLLDKKEAIISKVKEIRAAADAKAQTYAKEQGFDLVQQEIQSVTNKLGEEVQMVDEKLGKSLVEYKNRVFAIVDYIKEGKVTDTERLEWLQGILKTAVAPNILGEITESLNHLVTASEQARKKVEQGLASWPAREDLRKLVKREVPANKKEAGLMESIKNLFSGALNKLRTFFSPVEEAAADVVSSTEQLEATNESLAQAMSEMGIAG